MMRIPVDFEKRISLLGDIMNKSHKELLTTKEDGRKTLLIGDVLKHFPVALLMSEEGKC
jgi:maltooligosyltrehalose synthase